MKKIPFPLLAVALFVLPLVSFGQTMNMLDTLITTRPLNPTDQSYVEVYYNAASTKGNLGLQGFTGTVYAHTGVTTNLSSGWKYVIAGWSYNSDSCKMTNLGNNIWKLVISPNIRQFYHVPLAETILSLAFVFRSSDGSKTGRTSSGGDIFYNVAPSGLAIQITQPASNLVFTSANSNISVSVTSAFADSTKLFNGGVLAAKTTGTTINQTITASGSGQVLVKAIAYRGTQSVADSFYYYVLPAITIQDPPAGIRPGINYIDPTTVILCLYAPNKNTAFVLGDFNNWSPGDSYFMNKSTDGKSYWLQVTNLSPGTEYAFQYFVDGSILIPDPYTDKVLDPWNDSYITSATYPNLKPYPTGKTTGLVSILQTAQTPYNWQVTNFSPPKQEKLVIYELLVRDFTITHDYTGIMGKLNYLQSLGVNAIELMPISEFDGNSSWGYNPALYFAPDKYYGPKNELKQFIDACHSRGIAVIMDMVLNHSYGNSPFVQLYWDAVNSKPAANNPWYNVVSPNTVYSWGYDFNHQSPDTQALVDSINSYWMKQYKIDGFRYDFSKGFTNTAGDGSAYDASRIAILERMANQVWLRNPKAYIILEHFTANSEETVLANYGMMLWSNFNGAYSEAAMGYFDNSKTDLTWAFYTQRGWNKPHAVEYMESHDEERQVYKTLTYGNSSGTYNTKDFVTALHRSALDAAFFFTIPGPKMIWQFGELGYDYSINYCPGTGIIDPNGGCRTDPKPIRWDYYDNIDRWKLYKSYSALVSLKLNDSILDATTFDFDVAGVQKRIRLQNSDKFAVALGNFDVNPANVTPNFFSVGKWYDFFTGDSINVTNISAPISLQPGEYRLYLSMRVINTLGIENQKALNSAVDVFPNPSSEAFRVNIDFPGAAACLVTIYNIEGIQVAELYKGSLNNNLELNWQPSSKGVFIMKVQVNNQVIIKKLISI